MLNHIRIYVVVYICIYAYKHDMYIYIYTIYITTYIHTLHSYSMRGRDPLPRIVQRQVGSFEPIAGQRFVKTFFGDLLSFSGQELTLNPKTLAVPGTQRQV